MHTLLITPNMFTQNMPLLLIAVQRIIACSLHLMMNTCRILLRELLAAVDYEPELASEFEKILKNDVKLLLNPDKKGALSERVEGSRMQHTH